MTFRLPAERLETQVGGRLREIARTARIKGFRPGKVPTKVIEQRFGQQVRAEVLDGLLREGFDSAVREQRAAHRRQPADRAGAEAPAKANWPTSPPSRSCRTSATSTSPSSAWCATPPRSSDADIDRDDREPAPAAPQLEPGRRAPRRKATRSTLETWSQAGDERLPAEGVERGATVLGSGAMFAGDRSRRWSACKPAKRRPSKSTSRPTGACRSSPAARCRCT